MKCIPTIGTDRGHWFELEFSRLSRLNLGSQRQPHTANNAITFRRGLNCNRHKTDLVFISFSFTRKKILFWTIQKTTRFLLHPSLTYIDQLWKTRSFCDTFIEFWKHRFVMQPLQNPLLCSSTFVRDTRECILMHRCKPITNRFYNSSISSKHRI